ncbi:ABC transporter permease [Streptomyces sp. C10-9-1]|uniref:ABC transporter permease n=1 Tax=Streptomyces sp. C10-9-1 TaxID=1859285 RepID=UPI003D708EBC
MRGTPTGRMIAVMALVPVVVAVALWAFAWPAARTAPHGLPVGVAGPAAAATALEEQLHRRGDAFEVHRFADEAAAREAIGAREVYGALVASPSGPRLLTAPAAGPAVAQLLTAAAQSPDGPPVEVAEVAPLPAGDPRGSGFAASVLPLTLAGVAAGALVALTGLRGARAAGALAGAAALAGVTVAAMAHSWLGVLAGDWWQEAGALGLTTLAVGSAVAGLAALLGPRGIGLGGFLAVLLGNAFAGAAAAPELLPAPVGALGQWLPPGAGVSLVRSVSFFDGAGAGPAALALAAWVALGLAALALGARRRPGPAPAPKQPATAAA